MKHTATLLKSVAFVVLAIGLGCSGNNLTGDDGGNLERAVGIEVLGDNILLLSFNESKNMTVRVRYEDGLPAANRKVTFITTGATAGSTLVNKEVYTDNNGIAETEIAAGKEKAQFFVVVTSGNSNEVDYTIDVNGDYYGSLRVYYSYNNSAVTLSNIATRIHPGDWNCVNGIDWSDVPDSLPPYDAEKTASNSGSAVVFDNLIEGTIYTITATATGPSGNEVARGCIKAPAIVGRQLRTISVPMDLIPINFIGTYNIGADFYLPDLLPEGSGFDMGDVFNHLIDFFSDPGLYIVDNLNLLASELCGGDPTCSSITETLIDTIIDTTATVYCVSHDGDPTNSSNDEDYEEQFWATDFPMQAEYHCSCNTPGTCGNNTPNPDWSVVDGPRFLNLLIKYNMADWVGDVFSVGASISAMATNLTVGGTIEIDGATEGLDGVVTMAGTEDWNKFMFTWKHGACEWGDTSDPCCGRQVFGEDEDNQLNASSGKFTAKAYPVNDNTQTLYEIEMNEHALSLNYGNIFLYLLENVVFPEIINTEENPNPIPPPITISDLFIYILPMEAMSCWLEDLVTSDSETYDNCMSLCYITHTSGNWYPSNCPIYADIFIKILATLAGELDDSISELATNSIDQYNFRIETDNTAGLVNYFEDVDNDRQMDRLDLTLMGTINYGFDPNDNSAPSTYMTGNLRGEFQLPECISDYECEEGYSCQLSKGLVNECDAEQTCRINVGDRDGGAGCNNNSLCESGWCLSSPRICYAACENNDDCPNGYYCAQDEVTYTFIDTSVSPSIKYPATVNACIND